MKLYAPKYYKSFKCIADKCTHSCCIGWEIDIDEVTTSKYRALNGGYGEEIKNSIDTDVDIPCFKLCDGERCPHLNQKGLCNIILNYGEDYLCHICREHPRFYNETEFGLEVGIGMACEEAARIILSADNYGDFCHIGDVDGEEYEADFNAVACRTEIYQIISGEMPYSLKLQELYTRYGISPTDFSDVDWHTLINNLEYLDASHKNLFSCYTSEIAHCEEDKYLERALAYFIFRHCGGALDEEEFCLSLGLCLFLERLFASVIRAKGAKSTEDIVILARAISEEIEYSTDNTDSIKEMWQ